VEKKAKPPRIDDEEGAQKRKIRAELREAWSEQKDKKVKKEERRDKKDKRKQAEWEAKLAAGEEVGQVEAFKRARVEGEEVTAEYKALKREMKGEKGPKRVQVEEKGMFDDLD
jgi:ATP-dependent RNA helicase DDX55/SPB4